METLEAYNQELDICRKLFLAKAKDYGTSWRILRPSSLTDQIFIKASRIRSIQEKGVAKIDEGIDDAFKAIVNYSVMAIIQLDDLSYSEYSYDEAEKKYDLVIHEIRDLMLRKNHDYGEAWRDMRISSITDLILMKLLRIKQIEDNDGKTTVSEGLKSNYMDMVNYALFALILNTENT